jgi:hypothetical protein
MFKKLVLGWFAGLLVAGSSATAFAQFGPVPYVYEFVYVTSPGTGETRTEADAEALCRFLAPPSVKFTNVAGPVVIEPDPNPKFECYGMPL